MVRTGTITSPRPASQTLSLSKNDGLFSVLLQNKSFTEIPDIKLVSGNQSIGDDENDSKEAERQGEVSKEKKREDFPIVQLNLRSRFDNDDRELNSRPNEQSISREVVSERLPVVLTMNAIQKENVFVSGADEKADSTLFSNHPDVSAKLQPELQELWRSGSQHRREKHQQFARSSERVDEKTTLTVARLSSLKAEIRGGSSKKKP